MGTCLLVKCVVIYVLVRVESNKAAYFFVVVVVVVGIVCFFVLLRGFPRGSGESPQVRSRGVKLVGSRMKSRQDDDGSSARGLGSHTPYSHT